jgi:Uma2 family endonuclease
METTLATRHTYADYAKLPEGAPYQLIGGELVKEPPPTTRHQRIQNTFGFLLTSHVRQNRLGEVYYAPTDIYLADDEVYQPDILFVAADRLGIIEEKYIKGTPDLVLEILSPSTAYYDLRHKRRLYEQAGVKEFWIIDPIEGSIEVYVNTDGAFILAGQATGKGVVASVLLTGFAVEAEEIFAR